MQKEKRYVNNEWFLRNVILTILFITFIIIIWFEDIERKFILWSAIVYVLIVLTSIKESLILYENEFVLERKSRLLFLSSSQKITYSEIVSLRLISDQTTNERGWFLNRNKTSVLEITFQENKILRFKHLGAKEIKKFLDFKLIKSKM